MGGWVGCAGGGEVGNAGWWRGVRPERASGAALCSFSDPSDSMNTCSSTLDQPPACTERDRQRCDSSSSAGCVRRGAGACCADGASFISCAPAVECENEKKTTFFLTFTLVRLVTELFVGLGPLSSSSNLLTSGRRPSDTRHQTKCRSRPSRIASPRMVRTRCPHWGGHPYTSRCRFFA